VSAAPSKGTPRESRQTRPRATTLRDFHEEDKLGAAYDMQLLRKLWPFMRPHARLLAVSVGFIFFVAAVNLSRPLVMGRLVAQAERGEPSGLLTSGLLLSGLVVGQQVLSFLQMYTMQIVGARSMGDLRAHLFDFMQRLSLRYYDRTPVGRLVTRATNDVDAVGELFASGVLNAIGDLVVLLGIVVMMLKLDVEMSLFAFAALPLVGVVVWFVRTRARHAYRDIRVKTARLNAFLNEQVAGMSVVQAYAQEGPMAAEFDGINIEYREANKRSVFYEAVLDAAIEMVGTLCIASILWWSGIDRLRHPSTVATTAITFPLVVTFTQYIKQFFEPVSLLAQRYTILQSAMSGAERLFKFLEEGELESEPTRPQTPANAEGAKVRAAPTLATPPSGGRGGQREQSEPAVRFDGVTFSYKPGVAVLKDVSFAVNAGERIALVGATGAGKTTVTSLLLRLYEHELGTVSVFGRDVRDYDRRSLRAMFSVVPQDVFLFAGTVASNIAMSDSAPDMARVELALSRIDALDVFRRRQGGLLSPVDDRGANFSAGERQLIAFARALYKDSPLLILDEATANIDSDTEARLQAALEVVMQGRTALIVAHRLSTIRAVNRIIVFHHGKVVEVGTHEELIAKGGVYERLYRLQFAQDKREQPLSEV